MRGGAMAAVLLARLLAGCSGEPPACNTSGEVIIPADASPSDRAKWEAENRELALRRLDQIAGNDASRSYTFDSLKRAASCP